MQQGEQGATFTPLHDDEEVGGLQAGADQEHDVRMPQFAAGGGGGGGGRGGGGVREKKGEIAFVVRKAPGDFNFV
jgi:hypothetical protein